jgi:calcineurin-like phosphoesterase family protein
MNYDSTSDTMKHISRVRELMENIAGEILLRSGNHDKSKLLPPEKPIFDEVTPKLKAMTYGSKEYKDSLASMKPALDHHYANNRHHPEYFMNGIDGMNLVDLIEMICDWKCAVERHADGSITKSLEINKVRFGMSDQLIKILENTVVALADTPPRQPKERK